MSRTIPLDERENIRLTEEVIETRPPDRIAFAAEGVITMREALLGEFAGTSLKPVRVDVSVDDSRTVAIDLEEEASLRLDSVDVGVETPDTDDLSPGTSAIRSPMETDSESTDVHPGAIAFTVEGAIRDVPGTALDRISDGSPTLSAITFAVENPVRSDGGSGTDVIFEFTLLGYGIAVHRNGRIDVGTRGGIVDVELP